MTGNQYFIVILLGVLAYFTVNMVGLYIKHKRETRMSRELDRIYEKNIKIHSENMMLIETIKEVVGGKS